MELKDRLNGLTDARIFNIYGPTETSVHNCQGDITDEKSIHTEKPIGNCRYYLLDEERRPVPPTAVGEIYIAGECLSPGYINRQDLTDQAFLPDPFLKGEKMYRTGDRGRLRADGNWQCLGRVDTQIKLNGHRIEPLEITRFMLAVGAGKGGGRCACPASGRGAFPQGRGSQSGGIYGRVTQGIYEEEASGLYDPFRDPCAWRNYQERPAARQI